MSLTGSFRGLRVFAPGLLGLCTAVVPVYAAESRPMLREAECRDHAVQRSVACHALEVPENPDQPKARTIALHIMVLRARSETPASDPLFVIPGGPGQAATDPSLLRFFAEFFDPVREERDIVLVDPRGTGGSHPLSLEPAAEQLFSRPELNVPPEWGRAALPRLEREAELTQYTTARMVDDLDAVRRALGCERINLYGTSYGTRVAQYYIKRHGAHVRSAVFKGVTPPDENIALDYGRHPQRALEKLFALCAADSACAAAFPDLASRLDLVLVRLAHEPVTVETKHPGTGESVPFTITRGNFAFGVRSLMMNAGAFVQLPLLIDQAAEGDFSSWASFLMQIRLGYAQRLHGGMAFSVIASEDVPRLTEDAIRADSDGTLIGDALARGMAEIGTFWPRGDAPEDLFAPLETRVPILLVSGGLDPATPPAGAEAMLAGLPNGRHVVFAGGAHSAANFTGLEKIIAEFIREGSAKALDLSAAEANRVPPFAVPE